MKNNKFRSLNWFKAPMWQKILIAMILGVITGAVFGQKILFLEVVGDVFIKAIHMIVIPVLFFSIINAFISINDISEMRRIALKAILLYAICMLVAAAIGILVTSLIGPGKQLHFMAAAVVQAGHQNALSLKGFIEGLVPDNPFQAFTSGNIVQILIFAIIFGIAINLTKESAKPVAELCHSAAKVVINLAMIVMQFAPYGIFALIATVVGKYGIQTMVPLLKFIASVYLACFVMWVLYAIGVYIVTKKSPFAFYKAILTPLLTAYTTSSSAATLPVTIKCAEDNLGIQPRFTEFLLPLGTSLNLNGLSIYLSAATIFAANIYGIHLGWVQYITILAMIVTTAMGAAAVPGSALVVMGAIQGAVGIPLGAIPLIAGVDRFNDMIQTSTNVAGDVFTTYVVSELEPEPQLEESLYPEDISNS